MILSAVYFASVGQNSSDTLRLYFAINESQSEINFHRADSMVKALPEKEIAVQIIGYADYLHSNEYNLQLSQKRANMIRQHLRHSFPNLKITACQGMGERFSKQSDLITGEARQRRVDVIANYKWPRKNIAKVPPVTGHSAAIEKMQKGESLALEGLSFVPGRHQVMKQSMPVLEKLLSTMQANPNLKVEIQGHVCCMDGEDDGFDYDSNDQHLSVNRARAVYDYLVEHGIEKKRLSYKGFGHSRPKIKVENTPEEEQVNRRVEIFVIEK
jgi:outer membrane protein OmpA-like peptidoglycan-associated protein